MSLELYSHWDIHKMPGLLTIIVKLGVNINGALISALKSAPVTDINIHKHN